MPTLALTCALIVALATPFCANAMQLQQKGSMETDWQANKVIKAAAPDKQGRITVACPVVSATLDDKEFQGKKGTLVLHDPEPKVSMEEALKHPELRDRLEIRLAPAVVDQLKHQGIRDVAAHFKGHKVQATGKSTSLLYLCFPAVAVTTVMVERIEDIKVLGDNEGGKEKDPSPVIKL